MLSNALDGRTDWPLPPTPLIGRARECADTVGLLSRPEVRLVTLTGPGGIGKTRLALHTATMLRDRYPDGVVLVSLAPIADPSLVLATIAQSVGVRDGTGSTARSGIEAALGGKRLLLILDNLEHLPEAAPDIAWLLATCGTVQLLATSRAPLRIRGEHELGVPPLTPPDPNQVLDLAANDAVALFVERATSVDASFRLTPTSAPIIAEICRRLDGLPLAIELAAARVKILPPAALLARIERRLPLLTGGARDLPDRLRTMRDAIAWSYDLLLPEQQALFRHASVFNGGFTLHEATAVLAGEPGRTESGSREDGESGRRRGREDGESGRRGGREDGESGSRGVGKQTRVVLPDSPSSRLPDSVLDGLAGLVHSSLLRQVAREGEPRFLMLETLREFGLDRLADAGEAAAIKDRHAAFFLDFAEAAMERLRGAERTGWLERLDAAHGNLRAALGWLIDGGDVARALRLTGALWQFWWWRSHVTEGRRWMERALALPETERHPVALARTLTGSGALAETQGDYASAETDHARAVATWQGIGDLHGLAISLLFRWLVSFNADDQDGMTALSAESLRLFSEMDDPWGIAMSLMEQGVMAMRRRDHANAERLLGDGIARFRAIGDPWGVAICQGVLANVATDRRQYDRATALLAESLSALLLLNDRWGLATVLPAVARLAAEQGRWEWAVRLSGAIAELHDTMGTPLKVPFRERYEQTLAEARAALGEDRFGAAWAAGRGMTPDEAVAEALNPADPVPSPPAAAAKAKAMRDLAVPLSPREREVLRLIPGRTAREIGETLFISESTVRTHIEHILNKVGARNQKELIAAVYERGLI